MKQIIVMISMVALGLVIAGFVMGFETTAETLVTDAQTEISYTSIAGTEDPL